MGFLNMWSGGDSASESKSEVPEVVSTTEESPFAEVPLEALIPEVHPAAPDEPPVVADQPLAVEVDVPSYLPPVVEEPVVPVADVTEPEVVAPAEPVIATPVPADPAPAAEAAEAPAPVVEVEEPAPAVEVEEPAPVALASADSEAIAELREELAAVSATLAGIVRGNDWGRQSLARIQDEIDGYRNDFLARAQLPLLRRVCALETSIERLANDRTAREEPITASDLAFLADQVLEMLADEGIEPVEDAVGERFTGSRHKGVRAMPTTDEEAGGTIAEIISKGWMSGDKIIKHQEVSVFKYEAPAVEEAAVVETPSADEGEAPSPDTVPAPVEAAVPSEETVQDPSIGGVS